MKVKVLKRFRDKYNNDRIYEKDEVIDVTEDRYKEILTVDKLVEPVVEKRQEEENKQEETEEKKPVKRAKKPVKKESE